MTQTSEARVERNSKIVVGGSGRIQIVTAAAQHRGGYRFDGQALVHPSGQVVRLTAEKTAELAEAVATARPMQEEFAYTVPADLAGWTYEGISDDSGEYMPIYRRVVDPGQDVVVMVGSADVVGG